MTTDPLPPPGRPSPPSAPPSRRREAPVRVLVVDDEPDIREALEITIRGAGYDVATAETGDLALEAARRERFDVVVTDYRMPGLSGTQTLRALKQMDPSVRVIVATGYGSPELEAECRDSGADDYVRKPFDLREILEAVGRLARLV